MMDIQIHILWILPINLVIFLAICGFLRLGHYLFYRDDDGIEICFSRDGVAIKHPEEGRGAPGIRVTWEEEY